MKKVNRYALLLLVCVLAAGGMIFFAMFTYPIPYSWPKHYLSALGLTALKDGTPNLFTSLVFNGALVLSGVMTATYFVFRGKCSKRKPLTGLLWLAGLVAGLGLAGIGIFPYNLAPHVHDWCTWIASAGILVGIISAAGAVRGTGTTLSENLLWIAFGVFTLLVWFALQYLRTHSMLPSTPTGQIQQKIVVLFFWIYMFWNSQALYRATRIREQCEEERDTPDRRDD